MLKPLQEILAYQNKWVIERFQYACPWFKGTAEDAQLLFDDLKRFLWLNAKIEHQREANPELDLPDISFVEASLVLDEMWHAFVLYTQFYADFCSEYLGKFIHHPVPCEKYISNIKSLGKDKAQEIYITEMVECVMEELGEEVAKRWFDEYFKFAPPTMSGAGHHVTV